jgi:hypothetical protein
VVTPDEAILKLSYDDARALAEEIPGAELVPAEVTPTQYLKIAGWQGPPAVSLA